MAARALLRGLTRGVAAAADLLWPRSCPACDAIGPEGPLCDKCSLELLTLVGVPYCRVCGVSLGPNIPQRDDGCWQCPAVVPRFKQVVRLGPYTGPLRRIIRGLKFRRDISMVGRLSEMLAERTGAQCEVSEIDLVLAVPMHWRRRMSRDCNVASLLAAGLARRMNLPAGDELLRVRHTPVQTSLSRTARIANVRDAFSMRKGSAVADLRILLVDDVTTTGATADEAARTLLRAGAARVTLAVLAKSERHRSYTPPGSQS